MTAPTARSWKGSWVCPSQNTATAASGRHHPRSEGANPTVTAQVGVAIPAMTWSAITSALSRSCVTALPRSQELRLHSLSLSRDFPRITRPGTRRGGRPTQAWRCLSRIIGTVLNRTVLLRCRCHYDCMRRKKAEEESAKATLLAVKKEMAEPRMAKSARRTKTNPAAARIVRGNTKL